MVIFEGLRVLFHMAKSYQLSLDCTLCQLVIFEELRAIFEDANAQKHVKSQRRSFQLTIHQLSEKYSCAWHCVHAYTHIHTHTHRHTYTYTHIHTYTYTHIHTPRLGLRMVYCLIATQVGISFSVIGKPTEKQLRTEDARTWNKCSRSAPRSNRATLPEQLETAFQFGKQWRIAGNKCCFRSGTATP